MNSTPLSAEQIAAFETDGFLILPRLVSTIDCAEMASITNQHLRDAVAPLEYESAVGYAGAPT